VKNSNENCFELNYTAQGKRRTRNKAPVWSLDANEADPSGLWRDLLLRDDDVLFP